MMRTVPTPNFAQVVQTNFELWDTDRDGQLSKEELQAALNNPDIRGEAAAALAAICQAVLSDTNTNDPPAVTRDYLLATPTREPPAASDQADSPEDVSATPSHLLTFQQRYNYGLHQLRRTSRELLPQGQPALDAIRQGILNDCSFVSMAGAMVSRDPSAVKAMFSQNTEGVTTVTLANGKSFDITVSEADIATWSSAGTNGLWLTVLEKAYRTALVEQTHPRPEDRPSIFSLGTSVRPIEILDGHHSVTIDLRRVQPGSSSLAALRRDLEAAQREHLLVQAGSPKHTTVPGLTAEHAYAVLSFDEDKDVVRLWNPHGNDFAPKGPDGPENGYKTEGGQFDIPLSEMIDNFSAISLETQALCGN